MTVFRVWAPRPTRVDLATGADRRPMTRDGEWWSVDVADAGPGTDYGFVLDGDGPFPDPRSAWQPDGVHGPSRLVDHAAFRWTDHTFEPVPLPEAVFYELHVGTFTARGTFEGVIERLDHLVGLGVTHVELLPVVEFPGVRGWGYDGVDLFAPHHAYGGPEGLKRLVDACHARGLGLVIDAVYNHLGPDGNYLARFGPYFSDRYTTPWGDAVNFDAAGADEVRSFVLENVRMWIRDYHVDGLRLDAVHEMFDRSAVNILEEMASAVHELGKSMGRRACLIAESDLNDPRLVRDVSAGGYGLDGQWLDDFRHALHVALTGESDVFSAQYRGLEDVAYSLSRGYVFDGALLTVPRATARPAGRSGPDDALRVVPAEPRPGRQPALRRAVVEPPLARSSCVSPPAWCCWDRTCPCSSRARSGGHRRPSCTSPTMSTPGWPRRSLPDARRSSATSSPTAGPCPIRRMPPRSSGRGWTGPSLRASHTRRSSPGTARSSRSAVTTPPSAPMRIRPSNSTPPKGG